MAIKSTRFFLDTEVDSYVKLTAPSNKWGSDSYDLKMADCSRSINWSFYVGNKRERKKAKAKLKKFKDLIDKLYEELSA